jgi:RNA polymerase sigma-70 factor (ECF subfamily)
VVPHPEPRDELELARRCACGDRAAQRELFQDHKRSVHAALFRILGNNNEIEDLLQETFLQVLKSIGSFRGDAALGTWISRITTRVAFSYIRRRPKVPTPLESVAHIPEDRPDVESQTVAREAVRRLYAALDRVEVKQRVAYALHVIDGRSMKEVAEMTGATVVATKSRVWRARREVNKRAAKDPLLSTYLRSQEGSS